MDLVKYWKEKLGPAGKLSDEQIAAVEQVFSNPEVARQFGTDFVPHAQFASELDKTRNQSQKAIDALKEQNRKIDTWANQVAIPENERLTKVEKAHLAQLQAYRDQFGDMEGFSNNGNTDPNNASTGFSKDELVAMFRERDNQLLNVNTGLMEATVDYSHRFPEKKLDVRAMRKFIEDRFDEAQKTNSPMSVEMAYNEYISDDVAALNESSLQARIEKERAEAVAAAQEEWKQKASQTNQPDSVTNQSPFRLDIDPDNDDKRISENDRRAAFISAWSEENTPGQ